MCCEENKQHALPSSAPQKQSAPEVARGAVINVDKSTYVLHSICQVGICFSPASIFLQIAFAPHPSVTLRSVIAREGLRAGDDTVSVDGFSASRTPQKQNAPGVARGAMINVDNMTSVLHSICQVGICLRPAIIFCKSRLLLPPT